MFSREELKIGDRVIVKSGHFKNRNGKTVDSMNYNDKQKFKVVFDDYANGEIGLWFYDDELKKPVGRG